MDLREIGYGAGSSTELVQDRVQWQALVFSSVEPSGSATRELVNPYPANVENKASS